MKKTAMRQVGKLEDERAARTFTAYLITEGIEAHAERDQQAWAIWVVEEPEVERAKTAFEAYRLAPDSPLFQGRERTAQEMIRHEQKRREQAAKRVVDVRVRWGRPGTISARRTPLVLVLIVLSVLATLVTQQGRDRSANDLAFVDAKLYGRLQSQEPTVATFASIRSGQLWRLITPIFVHLTMTHLIFNMFGLYLFGAQIEQRKGTVIFGLLVLSLAVFSNIGQAIFETPFAFGMSGVAYGLFGYVWIKSQWEPASGFFVAPATATILVVWFFLCWTGWLGPVANTAHGVGLATGMLLGGFPRLLGLKGS